MWLSPSGGASEISDRAKAEGLRALLARDCAVERWLREEVGPAYDALKADPLRAITAADVKACLAAENQAMSSAGEPMPRGRQTRVERRAPKNAKLPFSRLKRRSSR